jgi:hypothetical protein
MPSNNDRLEALRKREAALREAIAFEKVRQQKKNEKDDARLHSIIGEALVNNAALHPDFELMLKGILKSQKSFTDGEAKLLRMKGWL